MPHNYKNKPELSYLEWIIFTAKKNKMFQCVWKPVIVTCLSSYKRHVTMKTSSQSNMEKAASNPRAMGEIRTPK